MLLQEMKKSWEKKLCGLKRIKEFFNYFYVVKILSICFQAQTYDPEGEYVAYWLPQLRSLPKDKRNFPGKSYIEQVVPLKFGSSTTRYQNPDMAFAARKSNFGHRQTRGQRR